MSVLSPQDIDRLEEEYKRAVKLNLDSFMFTNYLGDDYELDCSYVKYLLEYWKGEGDGRPYQSDSADTES